MSEHLQHRPDDWASASDQEWTLALMDAPALICPFFMAYARNHRPHCLRQALITHQDVGGYLGRPARRFLRAGR